MPDAAAADYRPDERHIFLIVARHFLVDAGLFLFYDTGMVIQPVGQIGRSGRNSREFCVTGPVIAPVVQIRENEGFYLP